MLPARDAGAQRVAEARAFRALPSIGLTSFDAQTSAGRTVRDSGGVQQVSAIAAGAMSYVLPGLGLGSFYAGNVRHGAMHLGVTAGVLATSVACNGGKKCGGAMDVATAAFLINWPWSVVTAVRDARAANKAQRAAEATPVRTAPRVSAPDSSAPHTDTTTAAPGARVRRGKVSVEGASALSFFVPGAGSLYAHNYERGFLHLAGHFALASLASGCGDERSSTKCSGTGSTAVVALIGNWVWSIVTAGIDARAYNARPH